MAQTLHLTFAGADVLPLTDGIAAVFNAEATDARRQFEVVRIVARTPAAWGAVNGTTMNAARAGLYRITAASGGDQVFPVKRDTGSASLPAQVACMIFPTSVTVSGAFLRRIADAPTLAFAGSNQWTSARVYGGSLYPYQHGHAADVMRFSGDANIERIVLREGEGVALVLDGYGWPRSGQFNITLRNASTGATYQYRSRDIGHAPAVGMAMLSIMNGAGSGVVLEVNALEFPNDGESNFPVFRIARFDSADDGQIAEILSADTGTTQPNMLVATRGDFASRLSGWGNGVPYDWDTTHGATFSVARQQEIGVFRRITGVKPFHASATPQFQSGEDIVLFDAPSGSGILLNPQEGVAVLAGRGGALETSTFAYLDLEMTVLHYPPPAGGTFPDPGDVDSGVLYGPNDNDFTGTLQQPAAGDVRLGTGFGAGGTEFTGTLDPGAGGGTSIFNVRRSR